MREKTEGVLETYPENRWWRANVLASLPWCLSTCHGPASPGDRQCRWDSAPCRPVEPGSVWLPPSSAHRWRQDTPTRHYCCEPMTVATGGSPWCISLSHLACILQIRKHRYLGNAILFSESCVYNVLSVVCIWSSN